MIALRGFLFLVMLLSATGFSSLVQADSRILALGWFQDPDGVLGFEQVTGQDFQPFANPLMKGQYHGTTWVRLRISPGRPAQDHWILRFASRSYMDEIALFDPVGEPMTRYQPRYTGDRHAVAPDDYLSLSLGFEIEAGQVPRDLYLRLRSTSIHYLDLALLTPGEARLQDARQMFAAVLLWGFLLAVLIWTIGIWRTDRERVIGAFIIKHTISVIHSFLVLGFGRILLPSLLGNGVLDTVLNYAHLLAAASGFAFELIFLREFHPPRWLWWTAVSLLGLSVAAFVAFFSGRVIEALTLNLYLISLGSFSILLLALTGRIWHEGQTSRAILPQWLVVSYLGTLLGVVVISVPPTLYPAINGVNYSKDPSLSAYPFLSSLLILILLELRRGGRETVRQETLVRLASAESEAREQARRREEQEKFLAHTSHELRTPMNGILGLTELALAGDSTDQERLEYLKQIAASGQILVDNLTEVLDISKIEAGRLELEQVDFDLNELLEGLASTWSSLARAKGLDFSLHRAADLPRLVRGDPVRVRQILVNYLGNALKFTASGGIGLAVQCANHKRLRFEVSDTGPGLSPEVQARLFQPYTQADRSIQRRHGGTGLGLSICRTLADLMAGEAGVRSVEGQGSCFWAELELGPAESPFPAAGGDDADAIPASLEGLEILVADDNRVNRLVVTRMLEKRGCRVTAVENGEQAVDAVRDSIRRNRVYDIVLMDVQMPVMDGLEATRTLRQLPGGSSIPVIALTAGVLTREREEALAAGMNDFATKPVQLKHLQARILRLIRA